MSSSFSFSTFVSNSSASASSPSSLSFPLSLCLSVCLLFLLCLLCLLCLHRIVLLVILFYLQFEFVPNSGWVVVSEVVRMKFNSGNWSRARSLLFLTLMPPLLCPSPVHLFFVCRLPLQFFTSLCLCLTTIAFLSPASWFDFEQYVKMLI